MRTFLKTMLTGKDNQSADVGRVIWALNAVALVGYTGWSVIGAHDAFNAITFATASGAIMAAGAASLGLKASTEPVPPQVAQ